MRPWLKSIRVDRGYTQNQVAEMVGISRCFYTQLESMHPRKGLRPKTAKSIGRVLGFDWSWFYQEEKISVDKYS